MTFYFFNLKLAFYWLNSWVLKNKISPKSFKISTISTCKISLFTLSTKICLRSSKTPSKALISNEKKTDRLCRATCVADLLFKLCFFPTRFVESSKCCCYFSSIVSRFCFYVKCGMKKCRIVCCVCLTQLEKLNYVPWWCRRLSLHCDAW